MNIAHLLLGSAQEFHDLPALARGTTLHLSYRELWRRVSVMSTHLVARFGLARGDRVAFAMANGVESIEVMYAIWHAGLCAVQTTYPTPVVQRLAAERLTVIGRVVGQVRRL